MNERLETPIVLAHAACTAGSVIHRTLVAHFDCVGLSEVGHGMKPKRGFAPLDPQYLMFQMGLMSDDDLADALFSRIEAARKFATERISKRLLVREHTHGYFFRPDDAYELTSSPSWYASEFEKAYGEKPPIIISVRNPVDSWLALGVSFPKERTKTFDEYCARYNRFLDAAERYRQRGGTVHLLSLETLSQSPEETIRSIEAALGSKEKPFSFDKARQIHSTGNSGRESDILTVPARRPYPRSLVTQAIRSIEYKKLTQRLNYPHLANEHKFIKGLISHLKFALRTLLRIRT